MSVESHNILITAPGGNIGSALIPHLLTQPNWNLILPTTNATRLRSHLPSNTNITIEEGSIADPTWTQHILQTHKIDVVFLNLTGTDELMTTLNILDALTRAETVKYLMYLSACGDFTSPTGLQKIMASCSAAHILVKTTIEQKLAHAAFPFETTVVGSMLFFSNDLRSKESMLQRGVFDERLGEKGVIRVSTRDIVAVVHNLVLAFPSREFVARKIQVGSLKRYTGAETAALWSQALGKDVEMLPGDGDGFGAVEEGFKEKVGSAEWGRDVRLMYEYFAAEGFGMGEEEYAVLRTVLGREVEGYGDWVMQVGEEWQ